MADGRATKTLYVGGLAPLVTSQVLHDAFIPFGPIKDITLPKPELPSNKDPHRGFGYVDFESEEDAKDAIDNMDQSELAGRVIKVNLAKERKAAGEGLGSKTAVWEQEGYLANNAPEENLLADEADDTKPMDPMQRLENLDVAGPRLNG